MPSTFDLLLGRLAEAFDTAGLSYMVIGGQAVLLYGEPRLTQDIDVTIGAVPDRLPDVLAALAGIGLRALVGTAFVEETLVLLCEDPDSRIRVDVIFSFSGYEQEALRRARHVDVAGTDVRFASREDLLIHKIVAGRPRDIEDARSVLLKADEVDVSYVQRWLGEFSGVLGQPFAHTFESLYRATRR
jgi:predicted nucleotidyltransferase